MNILTSSVIEAIVIACHQSETGERHGDLDVVCDIVEQEFAINYGSVKDCLAKLAFEKLFHNHPEIAFFVSMTGELNFVEKCFIKGDDDE